MALLLILPLALFAQLPAPEGNGGGSSPCTLSGSQTAGYVLTASATAGQCSWQASGAASVTINSIAAANYVADGGSTNAITGTTTTAFTSYAPGQAVVVKMAHSNTGPVTININSIGTVNVTKFGTTVLATGNLIAEQEYAFVSDGSEFQVLNPTLVPADLPSQACQSLSGSVTPNLELGRCFIVTGSSGGTTTISAPTNPPDGGPYMFAFCNGATPTTWSLPGTFQQIGTPILASKCVYNGGVAYDGSNYQGIGSNETPTILRGIERAAPGTTVSGAFACWWDSTNHILTCNENASGSNSNTAFPQSAQTHKFLTDFLGSGTFDAAQPTPTDVSLGNVTNDAQTKAAIMPNTAPSAGQVAVGNAGGTAYAPVTISGSCTMASTGAMTCTVLNLNVANAASTGTTTNKLVKLTGAPSTAVIAATTDTGGIVGICTANCGVAGTYATATIQTAGPASCVFAGATTAGDYVQISSGTGGDCADAGATYPTSGQVLGRVLSTNGGGGTYALDLFPSEMQASSGSGGVASVALQNNGSAYGSMTSGQNGTLNFTNCTVTGTAPSFTIACPSSSGMTWPGGPGITVCTGSPCSAWGSSLTAPSGTIVGTTDTQTLTNKRNTPRVVTCASGSPAGNCVQTGSSTAYTITPDSDNADVVYYSDTDSSGGLTIAADSGAPTNGQKMIMKLNCPNFALNLTFATGSTNDYEASSNLAFPTTCTSGKTDYYGFIWHALTNYWDLVAVAQGY